MFHETVTHASGESRGHASEAHGLLLLRRALKRGHAIQATPPGGASITWSLLGHGGRAAVRSITLAPHTPVGELTDATVRDLGAIDSTATARYGVRDGRRIITVGLFEIPALTTARYRARSLVTADRTDRVRLTLTARLGLLAREHQAGADTALCSCGRLTACPSTPEEARSLTRRHRETVAAEFVNSLSSTFAAAVAAS
ncbi:hypothetical protein FSY75_09390 [Streptomyces sp. TR1341]|uniref:hypothetical protein n=1 Tax=Streptomyces sp. TR1341 TaxID=2601266 RepID=UPI00138B058C|nr:hypothetical protein [Streptomyces sp. TR1341]